MRRTRPVAVATVQPEHACAGGFDVAMRPIVLATLATVLRIRLGRDPQDSEIDEAFDVWKRFYRRTT